jgi:hypothetical protein
MAASGRRSRKPRGFSLAAAGEAVGTAMGRAVGRVERMVRLARQRIAKTRRASNKRAARPRRKAARTRV